MIFLCGVCKQLLEKINGVKAIALAVFAGSIFTKEKLHGVFKGLFVIGNNAVAPGGGRLDPERRTGVNDRFRSALSVLVELWIIHRVVEQLHRFKHIVAAL